MAEISPLFLKGSLASTDNADPDDVLVAKRSLTRLKQYEMPEWGLSRYPDTGLFTGIRNFQQDQGLRVDGIMHPGGPTAAGIGAILSVSTPAVDFMRISDKPGAPTPEECDHLFWNIDIPTCRAILARRGKYGAARCFHTASARYGACLHGTPINQVPPLDTWNQ